MKVNERIYTPRFCTVMVEKIFENRKEARQEGYTEPTYYKENGFTILGKSTGMNTMVFAGVKE